MAEAEFVGIQEKQFQFIILRQAGVPMNKKSNLRIREKKKEFTELNIYQTKYC